jgi:hypothetical protein
MQNTQVNAVSWWDMSPHELREKINQRIMSIFVWRDLNVIQRYFVEDRCVRAVQLGAAPIC